MSKAPENIFVKLTLFRSDRVRLPLSTLYLNSFESRFARNRKRIGEWSRLAAVFKTDDKH